MTQAADRIGQHVIDIDVDSTAWVHLARLEIRSRAALRAAGSTAAPERPIVRGMEEGPLRFPLAAACELQLWRGDLTTHGTDAIVNAANERMLGGGGVDGAIHRAAGPGLLEACHEVPEVRPGVRCPTGEARCTTAGNLPARFVIHTVGPVYSSTAESAPLLEAAYTSSLQLANDRGLATIAFPAISCGVFGYPLDEAADTAIQTCRREAGALVEIRFVLFGADAYTAWRDAAARLCQPAPGL